MLSSFKNICKSLSSFFKKRDISKPHTTFHPVSKLPVFREREIDAYCLGAEVGSRHWEACHNRLAHENRLLRKQLKELNGKHHRRTNRPRTA